MSTISVPLDASQIPANEREKQKVRVAAQCGKEIVSTVVSVGSGKATAKLELKGTGLVTIAVGPEATAAADLFKKSTPTVTVRPQTVDGRPAYTVRPIIITYPIWLFWLRWCRTFTITGTVIGQDGNPVPSAQVSAFNVDRFWWWFSTGQVGPTVLTDTSGNFSISFEWCCGWLPWFWWELRNWRPDPLLVDKINSVLQLDPDLQVSAPSSKLSLSIRELNPQPLPPFARSTGSVAARPVVSVAEINSSNLQSVGPKLLKMLPAVPEFERICLWPWCPWLPWLECAPNIIFEVTQSCGGPTQVIYSESVFQAHMDIPTDLNVTLTASAAACTIPVTTIPDAACFAFSGACGIDVSSIGLTGAPMAGLVDPTVEDRPFTGATTINGILGNSTATPHYADYYGVQYRPEGSATWSELPPGSLGSFGRSYFNELAMWPHQWSYPQFATSAMPVSGASGETVNVYMSMQYYQDTHPDDWAAIFWCDGIDIAAVIDLEMSGAFEFQLVGYTANADGTVTSTGAIPGCGLANADGVNGNNDFSLYFASVPTGTNPYPTATISTVKFDGVPLAACGIVTYPPGESFSFEADFTAFDAEGFLDSYSLQLQWGTNSPDSLLACGCADLPMPSCNLTTTAGQVGPCYLDALGQGAIEPFWNGGSMTFTIADASSLFSQSCAYQLTVTAYKRNIVDCNTEDVYQTTGYYSFTVLRE